MKQQALQVTLAAAAQHTLMAQRDEKMRQLEF